MPRVARRPRSRRTPRISKASQAPRGIRTRIRERIPCSAPYHIPRGILRLRRDSAPRNRDCAQNDSLFDPPCLIRLFNHHNHDFLPVVRNRALTLPSLWSNIRRNLGIWGMVNTNRRVGIVLFQLGGPDTLEAIEPFLYNLFCDPDIIDFPFARIGRKALAKLISTTRSRKVQHHYSVIGGGSPIRRFTEQQALALQSRLHESGIDARCFVAMRYWHPFTAEAITELEAAGCDEVVLLPLYPHHSSTTTGSSLNEWNRLYRGDLPVHTVGAFYKNDLYLEALVEKIDEALSRFSDPGSPEIIFSAHSVPVSVIERGDPYQHQIEETVELLGHRGGWTNSHRLCYQSKVGASKWLQPSLHRALRDLSQAKVREVCIVPIAFVSDHVETLGEIDHEAREEAAQLGIEKFEMTSGLNDSPVFIAALAELVATALGVGMNQARAPVSLVAAD
jgi:ferrochelatase